MDRHRTGANAEPKEDTSMAKACDLQAPRRRDGASPSVTPAKSLRLFFALGVMTWLVSACASLEPVQQFAAGVDGLARSSNDFYRMSAESDRRLRMKVLDPIDREALNSQINALSKWWQKIDDARAAAGDTKQLEEAAAALGQITREVNKARDELKKVAVVIHNAARAIAVAEKVAKLLIA
jgi:hypothetical protein